MEYKLISFDIWKQYVKNYAKEYIKSHKIFKRIPSDVSWDISAKVEEVKENVLGYVSILEMDFKAMPQIAASVAQPLEKVDKITMYGEGNSAKMVSDIMQTSDQIMQAIGESTGLDMKTLIASYLGSKSAQ